MGVPKFKVGDVVIVLNRRARDREAEITEVINGTVFRVRYTGKDSLPKETFVVGITSIKCVS
jgi:hypothetical protein